MEGLDLGMGAGGRFEFRMQSQARKDPVRVGIGRRDRNWRNEAYWLRNLFWGFNLGVDCGRFGRQRIGVEFSRFFGLEPLEVEEGFRVGASGH